MFQKAGISHRILLLTLLPTLLLTLLFASYFSWARHEQGQQLLHERGRLLGEQLAILAAPALGSGDGQYLKRLANETLEHPGLRAITLLDSRQQSLAHAGPRLQGVQPAPDPHNMTLHEYDEQARFLIPVLGRYQLGQEGEQNASRLLGWIDMELDLGSRTLENYRHLALLLLLLLSGLLLIGLWMYWLIGKINRPLQDIREHLGHLRNGDWQVRLAEQTGNPELDGLAHDINLLAHELYLAREEQQQGIEQATADLRQSMDTLEQQKIELNLELAHIRKSAVEANHAQSSFLANVSHEIRTPLNALFGFSRLLLKTRLDSHQQECVTHIHQSAHNLLDLLNNILDLSKLEAGKLQLSPGPLDLRDLIEETLTMQAPNAHEKGLELASLYYQDTPRMLIGDAQRLRQILNNLLNNAIKFTREGGITVRTCLDRYYNNQALLRISVQDSGIGISQSGQRELFHAFTQVDSSSSRRATGSGLGLAICKSLVEQMGGEIGVESEPGIGSEFWIHLPFPLSSEPNAGTPPLLRGEWIALLEPHEATCYQLRGLLNDCQMQLIACRNDSELLAAAEQRHASDRPLRLAVIGMPSTSQPNDALKACLLRLQQLGCQPLLLCASLTDQRLRDWLDECGGTRLGRPVRSQRLQQELSNLLSDSPATVQEPNSLFNPENSPNILCVDDNPANLRLIRTLLTDMGVCVTAVGSGAEAVCHASQQTFDMVLMDVQMPGMDGRDATEAIRLDERTRQRPAVPIVALTAHALPDERRELLQRGMDDYLSKPATEQQLVQMIRKWTGRDTRVEPGRQKSTPPAPAAVAASLPVFDAEESLQLAAGKPALAREMLQMLLDTLPAERQAIHEAFQQPGQQLRIERVHRLHGATRYCGVPQLRQACQQCETRLKEGLPADDALASLDAAIQRLIDLSPRLPE